jgi:multidrug efflux pump subunit AcrB
MQTFNDHGLLAYFTRHRVAANLVMIGVLLAGLIALNRLHTQLLPDITIPVISIDTDWIEASAENVERNLTTPLESALRNLADVEEVWSWSSQGHSSIVLRYRLDAQMDDALAAATNFMNGYSELPEGAQRPKVVLEANKEAVFSLLVTTAGPVTELRPLVQQFKNDLLARGIAEVDVRGFPDEEIRIETKMIELYRHQLSLDRLATGIAQVNRNNNAGQLVNPVAQVAVTTNGRVEHIAGLQTIAVNNQPPLASYADVSRQTKDGARHYVLSGKEVVRLLIFRSEQVDSLVTSDLLYRWLDEIRPTLPSGVEVVVWWDMAELVKGNLDMLLSNGILGLFLVVAILFFFLNRQVAFWSAAGIPISIAGTFLLLYGSGGTINFLSVFAFLMALGIIVDDAIVVGEETVTQIELGKPANEAALLAARRMLAPVMASSLTTIAAFLPLLMLPGPFGEMLRPVPVIIISVIIASLIECFLILPGHLNHSLSKRKNIRSPFRLKMDAGFLNFKENYFRPLVTLTIHHRGIAVSLVVCLCVIAVALPVSGTLPFSPEINVEDNMVTASVSFHDGTSADVVADYTEQLKQSLRDTDDFFATGSPLVTQVYEIYSADEGFAQVQAKLINRDDRPVSNAQFLRAWGERIKGGPDVDDISTNEDSASSAGASQVSFFLAGRNLDDLKKAAEALKIRLAQYPSLTDISDDLPYGHDEIVFSLNALATRLGLTEADLSSQLRQALMGVTAQSFTEHDATVEVTIGLPASSLTNTANLQDLPIHTAANQWVRFGDIANFTTQQGLGTLYHNNGQLGVRVSAVVLDAEADSNALSDTIYQADVAPILAQYGLTGEIQGSAQDIQEMLTNLIIAAVTGILLIYFILVWVFANYSWPLAVMAAIPFGLTGAVFGHWVLGINLTFLSFFGLFGLAGIVINDSIILINRYQELRSEGMAVEPAIIEASCQRLRAVLLTSITTIGGLIPILLSDSIQAQLVQSMATSLAFGIGYGTFLVLLVIPCLLTYIESINAFNSRWLAKLKGRSTASLS